jgi:hypothetical protein
MRSEEAWTGDRAELVVQKPSAEVFRAAAANHWRLGVDGLYTAHARPGAVERPPEAKIFQVDPNVGSSREIKFSGFRAQPYRGHSVQL